MPRLLVLSCGAGAGHNRAAEAVAAAAKEQGFDAEWDDVLKYTSRVFKALYADSYVWMASHSPQLWGALYKMMGKPVPRPKVNPLMKAYDSVSYGKFMKRVRDFKADAIICTHFLPPNVIKAHLGKDAPPLFTVVTDFDVHSMWIHPGVDGYFVGNEQVKWIFRGYEIPASRVHVTGIPIHPVFSRTRGVERVRHELGLQAGLPAVLFMSGGFGMGDMEQALERILALDSKFQLIVVAGKNEKMKAKLEKVARGAKRPVRICGFVNNVHDLMEGVDLLISKAGGLTSCESLARQVPLIVFSPVPGQEEMNADFLCESGAAVKAHTLGVLDYKVKELLDAPSRLDKMRKSAAAIARPFSARDVVAKVVEHLK